MWTAGRACEGDDCQYVAAPLIPLWHVGVRRCTAYSTRHHTKEFNKNNSLSHSRQARHRCGLACASTIKQANPGATCTKETHPGPGETVQTANSHAHGAHRFRVKCSAERGGRCCLRPLAPPCTWARIAAPASALTRPSACVHCSPHPGMALAVRRTMSTCPNAPTSVRSATPWLRDLHTALTTDTAAALGATSRGMSAPCCA